MTTIANLSGAFSEQIDSIVPDKNERVIVNTQSGARFSRSLNHYKDRMVFQSSAGGMVKITVEELWKLAESADERLKIPIAENNKTD